MRPGNYAKEHDMQLDSILVQHKLEHPNTPTVEIRAYHLNLFNGDENFLMEALSRAQHNKKIGNVNGTRVEDLIPPDFENGSPVVAVVELLKISPRKKLPVVWKNPKTVGDFQYCKNGVGDVVLKWRGDHFSVGELADMLVVFLLEQGTPQNDISIANYTGGTVGGVRQMISRINKKARDKSHGIIAELIVNKGGYVLSPLL